MIACRLAPGCGGYRPVAVLQTSTESSRSGPKPTSSAWSRQAPGRPAREVRRAVEHCGVNRVVVDDEPVLEASAELGGDVLRPSASQLGIEGVVEEVDDANRRRNGGRRVADLDLDRNVLPPPAAEGRRVLAGDLHQARGHLHAHDALKGKLGSHQQRPALAAAESTKAYPAGSGKVARQRRTMLGCEPP